ncbi:MAG: aldo/keto reductase [Gemmatimonadetes bacterium]|nr:aldo/keto reductase [Gemmatimonadota bacterium]|tara:strand:- start:451 stop:1440 length:990 start_codon:yes stop_codon:yes gene_type:complete
MKFRKLGRTGIDVSVFALGCWPFAGGAVWGDQDDDVSIATVHAALDAGINFFDTAEGYEKGHSERVLGRGLEGRRDEAVIATKVNAGHLKPDDIVKACEQSLENLRTDYIDLYQIHWPNWEVPIEVSWHALETLKSSGKVRALGVSNFGVQDLGELLDQGHCETNQLNYGLLWRVVEHEIQPLCKANDVGLICYSPLAQGLLTGRYASADEVPDGLARTRWYNKDRAMAKHGEEGCEEEVFEALGTIREISEGLGQQMATVSLAWVRQQLGVTSVLVGARSPEELAWNTPVYDLTLPDDVIAQLNAATEVVKSTIGLNPDPWMVPSRMR